MKACTTIALSLLLALSGAAAAEEAGDTAFFDSIGGSWSGSGEIVAGKYKGTRFNCSFDGRQPESDVGMTMEGSCRVGLFTQNMRATVRKTARSYTGQFLDGAQGKGLDVVSGDVAGSKLVMGLRRAELDGAMVASLKGRNAMDVTVSVRIGGDYLPIIGLRLKRAKPVVTGALR